jgi:hypothetical protein
VQNKRFSYFDCVWYFEYLRDKFPLGSLVTYRHVGNGHDAHTWGYDRYRVGTIKEWIKCDNPEYLWKVRLLDSENNLTLTVHPDLIDSV